MLKAKALMGRHYHRPAWNDEGRVGEDIGEINPYHFSAAPADAGRFGLVNRGRGKDALPGLHPHGQRQRAGPDLAGGDEKILPKTPLFIINCHYLFINVFIKGFQA